MKRDPPPFAAVGTVALKLSREAVPMTLMPTPPAALMAVSWPETTSVFPTNSFRELPAASNRRVALSTEAAAPTARMREPREVPPPAQTPEAQKAENK